MADSIQKPQVLARPFCSNGDKNTIPDAATGTNLASLQEGFPEITGKPLKNGGIPPERRDFNGLLNLDSQFYFAFQNGWRPTFDADVSTAIGGYAAGAILWCDSGNYFVKSLKNNNTDNFVLDPSKIDGVSWKILTAGDFRLPLLSFNWYDHVLNDESFVNANDFSWIPGSTYTSAYNHLVDDIDGKTSQTETVGSYTITYYLADDGHKIVLADQENTVSNIYAESGVAWYYILDTGNTQFKLPRQKMYQIDNLNNFAPDYSDETNISSGDTISETGWCVFNQEWQFNYTGYVAVNGVPVSGTYLVSPTDTSVWSTRFIFPVSKGDVVTVDNTNRTYTLKFYPSKVFSSIQNSFKYLYFYVGNFSQSATEQTAGLNSELFNQKVDKADMTEVQCIVETYSNGTDWYRVWSDGWCEQGGKIALTTGSVTLNFLKAFKDTNYNLMTTNYGSGYSLILSKSDSSASLKSSNNVNADWKAEGYIS